MIKNSLLFASIFVSSTLAIRFPIPHDPQAVARQAFDYTNQFRVKKGLLSLRWNDNLAHIALKHSQDMGNTLVAFGHAHFHQRIEGLPFHVQRAAENVFMGNMSGDRARTAVDSWITSPGHLKNLVGNYVECGIGVYRTANDFWYFTQIFATIG
jgi:uncharacterized protein YkwD